MLNALILKIQRMPKLLLGFLVILATLVGLRFYNPPLSICQVQMEEVQARLGKGFYQDSTSGLYGQSVLSAFDFCVSSNSAGGCYDMFQRLRYFEQQVKTLPEHCGSHVSAEPIEKALKKALRLFAQIAWGDKPPANKYNRTSWLDIRDIGLFCRLKVEYQRLFGKSALQEFILETNVTLPGASDLTSQEVWERCLFSYPCKGLY